MSLSSVLNQIIYVGNRIIKSETFRNQVVIDFQSLSEISTKFVFRIWLVKIFLTIFVLNDLCHLIQKYSCSCSFVRFFPNVLSTCTEDQLISWRFEYIHEYRLLYFSFFVFYSFITTIDVLKHRTWLISFDLSTSFLLMFDKSLADTTACFPAIWGHRLLISIFWSLISIF